MTKLNEEKQPTYKILAEYLLLSKGYQTVEDIAIALNIDAKKVRHSMSFAKRAISTTGLVLANKRKHGYIVTNDVKALISEADKSLKRAKSHIGSSKRNIYLIRNANQDVKLSKESESLLLKLEEDLMSFDTIDAAESSGEVSIPEHILASAMEKIKRPIILEDDDFNIEY